MLDSICVTTVAAKSRLLATLPDLKIELDISGGAEDQQLQRWLAQASAKVESHTHRTLVRESFQETFRPVNGLPDYLSLAHYPVVSITQVEADECILTSDQYEVDADTGALYRLMGDRRVPWWSFVTQISYDAGYTAGADLPFDLQRAVIALVKQYRFARNRDPLASNVDISGAGATRYFGGVEDPNGLAPEIEGLIAPYKY